MSVTVCLFIHCHSQYVLILISFSNSTINFWNLCGRTWKTWRMKSLASFQSLKKLRTNITQEGKLYFSGSMDVYRFTDELRMNLGNVNDFQPAIGGPTTRHCSGSSVRDPKKTFGWGGRGIGLWKCMDVDCGGNTWQFSSFIFFFRETRFETWTKILSLKHGHVMENDKFFEDIFFFKSRFDQHPFAPQDCRASAWCKALRFCLKGNAGPFFGGKTHSVQWVGICPDVY